MAHVTSTHISSAIASHMDKPDVDGESSIIFLQGGDQEG